jgi:hypothetical protein
MHAPDHIGCALAGARVNGMTHCGALGLLEVDLKSLQRAKWPCCERAHVLRLLAVKSLQHLLGGQQTRVLVPSNLWVLRQQDRAMESQCDLDLSQDRP